MPFKDELKTNFNLNDQRISEVGDLMDQIRIAASKRYKDGKADRNEQANDVRTLTNYIFSKVGIRAVTAKESVTPDKWIHEYNK